MVGVIAEFDVCIRGMAESIALLDAHREDPGYQFPVAVRNRLPTTTREVKKMGRAIGSVAHI